MSVKGFTYVPGCARAQLPVQLFAWQICLVHLDEGALEDAGNYADYAINRGRITQALGIGMARGQNAFQLDDQLFAATIGNQGASGGIELVGEDHPRYADIAAVVAEQLLRGEDHGMVVQLPNGNMVPFSPQAGPADL